MILRRSDSVFVKSVSVVMEEGSIRRRSETVVGDMCSFKRWKEFLHDSCRGQLLFR